MTNKEWTDFIAKEFKVSNTQAKGMLHAMYTAKSILDVSKDVRKENEVKALKEESQLEEYERMDEEDSFFL